MCHGDAIRTWRSPKWHTRSAWRIRSGYSWWISATESCEAARFQQELDKRWVARDLHSCVCGSHACLFTFRVDAVCEALQVHAHVPHSLPCFLFCLGLHVHRDRESNYRSAR